MHMQPLFTVVIPTYNSSSYITNTLKSIICATKYKNYEVIIVDDSSEDADQLLKITNDYSNISVIIKEQKSNAAESRNIGYLNSSSRFVFFLDSDDSYLPEAIDKRLSLHKQYNAGVIFGNFITNFGNHEKTSSLPIFRSQNMRDYILLEGGDVRSSVISIDKEYYKKSMFDSNCFKHQDWAFAIRCWDNEEKIIFDSNNITTINVDRDTRMSSSFNIEASEYFCQLYLQNPKHINAFSKRNWIQMIISKDRSACNFFIALYEPSENIDMSYHLFKILSYKRMLPFSSIILNKLRQIKHKFT